MSALKKKIPVIILETLEPIFKEKRDKIKLVDPGDFCIKLVDNDPDSDFHFQIEQHKMVNNEFQVLLSIKPRSKEIVDVHRTWIEFKTLEQSFINWISIVERYDKIENIYNDPIERKYYDEFYAEFEIIDTDADIVSFNLEQQLFLDSYLDRVNLALEQFNPNNSDKSLTEIKNQFNDLKNELTKLTKKQVIEKLSRIWAKTRKVGLPILKEIYVQIRNELIKQLIQVHLEIK